MRKIFTAVLAASLVLLNSFSVFASVASPSVASPSVARPMFAPMEENVLVDSFDSIPFPSLSLAAVSPSEVTNTVDYSDCYIDFVYYDMHNVTRWSRATLNSDGTFSFSLPSDFASFVGPMSFVLTSGAMPPPGKYDLTFSVGFDVGGHSVASVNLSSNKDYANAEEIVSRTPVSYSDIGGDIVVETAVDINSGLLQLFFQVYFTNNYIEIPNSGLVKFQFKRISSSSSVDVNTAGSDMSDSASDTAENTSQIADNTAQIVEGQDSIMETIKEQVQYITMQLEAFWNQLAGEFTNLFNKMNDQLSQMLNGIEDQTEEITGALGDVESEINQSTTEINNNIDQSTNQITNGYDNSSLNQAANDYHSADQALDSAQDTAWDQGADRVNEFEFGDFTFSAGIMSALVYCGNWLQNVYDGIGNFGIPITLGLTVVFALMIIGYYRYRS